MKRSTRKKKPKGNGVLRSVLKICFSVILISLAGCSTFGGDKKWPLPHRPETTPVKFVQVDGGFFISDSDIDILINNIDERKAYIEKLELLVDKMQKF